MSRIVKALDARDAHIKTLRAVIGMLAGGLLFAMHGWSTAPDRIVIDIPPDLSEGSSQAIGERLPGSVFQFSHYVFQALNNWQTNGRENYADNIEMYSCYLTPRFQEQLKRDYEKKERRNELTRTRYLMELPGHGYEPRRVYIEGNDSWVSFHDVKVVEAFAGETIKEILVRYPLRVVSWTASPQCNQFGLALDGFYAPPKRLEEEAQSGDVTDMDGERADS